MTRFYFAVCITSAVVLIGLGGFFWVSHGKAEYKRGYATCIGDGAVLATEAARQLHDVLTTPIQSSDIDRMLDVNGWMRDEADR